MWLIDSSFIPMLEKALAAQASGALLAVKASSISNVYPRKGSTAVISVNGLLTAQPNPIASFFGIANTSYAQINSQLLSANADESIKQIELDIDSPGGEFAGFYSVVETMGLVDKPIVARVSGLAASAAYGIASQADSIVATSKAASFGSIGVAFETQLDDKTVVLTSTHAPYKRPDLKTDEGKAHVIERLDELHDLFVGAIATGRKTDKEKINENYGKGAVLLAEAALSRGMIDKIETLSSKKEGKMNLETLKSEHASLYTQVQREGAEQAADAAIADERERVSALLELAVEAGDASLALEHIKSGAQITPALMKTFISSAKSKQFVADRADDNVSYSQQTAGGVDPVLAALAAKRGIKLNG